MTAIALKRDEIVQGGGEFALSAADFATIASVLYKDSGIRLNDTKVALVYSRLAKRLRLLGLRSFAAYCELITSDQDEAERGAMLSALTTNVTRFFREPHHFDDLRDRVLPDLVDRARAGARVRLWSAGCSIGHEPYSMAMTLLGVEPDAAQLDIRILASDIDPQVIARCEAGRFSDGDVSPAPADLKTRWMRRSPSGEWAPTQALASLVRFRVLNLLEPWPMKGRFDIIFCRNVAIYFDEPTQAELFGRFAQQLVPGGRLYLGHSERASHPLLTSDGLTTYRRPA